MSRPVESRPCNTHECPGIMYKWRSYKWSPVSQMVTEFHTNLTPLIVNFDILLIKLYISSAHQLVVVVPNHVRSNASISTAGQQLLTVCVHV